MYVYIHTYTYICVYIYTYRGMYACMYVVLEAACSMLQYYRQPTSTRML